MARQKNGWIKLYSSVLDKDLTPVEFKIWVGLLLIANTAKSKNSGLVDLPLRAIAKHLRVSLGALVHSRDKFIDENMVEIVKLPGKTKPIQALKIVNYDLYQGQKFVLPSEHSLSKKVIENEQSSGEIVLPNEQNVHSIEQSVSPSEHSLVQNTPTKNNKECTKNKSEDQAPKKSLDPFHEDRKKIFTELQKRRDYPNPKPGAEAKAITWMLKQGYTVGQIMIAYDKMTKDNFWSDKMLTMVSVKNNIGVLIKGKGRNPHAIAVTKEHSDYYKEFVEGNKDGKEKQ